MMSSTTLYELENFKLQIQLDCLDCNTVELVECKLGYFFNLEGDYITSEIEEIFFVNVYAQAVKTMFSYI